MNGEKWGPIETQSLHEDGTQSGAVLVISRKSMVGVTGFEPATNTSRTCEKCKQNSEVGEQKGAATTIEDQGLTEDRVPTACQCDELPD